MDRLKNQKYIYKTEKYMKERKENSKIKVAYLNTKLRVQKAYENLKKAQREDISTKKKYTWIERKFLDRFTVETLQKVIKLRLFRKRYVNYLRVRIFADKLKAAIYDDNSWGTIPASQREPIANFVVSQLKAHPVTTKYHLPYLYSVIDLIENHDSPLIHIYGFEFTVDRIVSLARKFTESYLSLRVLAGVQPLSGPVGLIYYLRYVDSGRTTSNISGVERPLITLEVISNAVESKIHPVDFFRVSPSVPVSTKDVYAYEAIINGLSEIPVNLIAWEVLEAARSCGYKAVLDVPKCPRELTVRTNILAADIAERGRRGLGNIMIVGEGSKFPFKLLTQNPEKTVLRIGELNYVGHSGNLPVYSTAKEGFEDLCVIGYVGQLAMDAGIIASPYTPVAHTHVHGDGPPMSTYWSKFDVTVRKDAGLYWTTVTLNTVDDDSDTESDE